MKSADTSAPSLLADLLAETAPADFRAAVLDATLRHARRRRRLRRACSAVPALVACLLLAAPLLLSRRSATSTSAPDAAPAPALASCEIIRTRADATATVVTRPLATDQRLASLSLAASDLVRTDPRFGPLLIDDTELLALAPHASALVRLGPGRQRLVFANESPAPDP